MGIFNSIKKFFFTGNSVVSSNDLEIILNLLKIESKGIKLFLSKGTEDCYHKFKVPKRRGGFRTISAPNETLSLIQKQINTEILIKARIHDSAKGFRKKLSISDNAKPHLNQSNILKVDIFSFFSTITEDRVIPVFMSLGHEQDISEKLAKLCCLNGRLPQGAPTSPLISNIVAYKLDEKLNLLASRYNLVYTRYADDLTFSGSLEKNNILSEVIKIIESEGFHLNDKKTQFMEEKHRKIITGISISSGKMTIPKSKKREIRKNVHFILKRGLDIHQKHINSTDPAYLKRIIGYLNFWLSIEPDNEYVKDSIRELRKIKKKFQ